MLREASEIGQDQKTSLNIECSQDRQSQNLGANFGDEA